jgi:hypothetical protein
VASIIHISSRQLPDGPASWIEKLPDLTRKEAEQHVDDMYGACPRIERNLQDTVFRFVGFKLIVTD